jgi:methanogenic corrinoid protein MtbC1
VDGVRVIGDVLTPAMRRIGDLWEQNRIGVADEHLATAITERALAQVYPTLFRASPLSRERVIVSSVEGEQHVLGLRMVADILEGNGYEVLFLGADVRVSALLAAIDQHRPAAIALGCTGTWSTETLLTTLTQLQRHPSLPIMLGGIGVPERVPPEGLTLMRVTHIDQLPAAMEQALGPRTGASEVAASA